MTTCELCTQRATGDTNSDQTRANKLLLEMLSGSPKTIEQIVAAHDNGCHECLINLTGALGFMCAMDLAYMRGGPEQAVTFLKASIIEDENDLDG
jgi:hypothetical protein